MDKLSKKNRVPIGDTLKEDIELHVMEWWAQDEPTADEDDMCSDDNCNNCEKNIEYCRCVKDEYSINCFGVTKSGVSLTCKITGFKPFYYIKVDDAFGRLKLNRFLNYISSSYALKHYPNALAMENGKHKSCVISKKDIWGFRNGKQYNFVKLVFTSWTALMKSRYLFKKPINIAGVTNKPTKFKLYESNFEGFMRYCHIKDIRMAGWIKLPKGKYRETNNGHSTQLEVEIDRKAVVSMSEKQDIAPFLQASWDIEVYSHDYTFPDPHDKARDSDGNITKPNEIFQIATTYKQYGDDDVVVKHLLTLKKCAKITEPNVIVEECRNEKELIKRWVDTIRKMDPDILYTYNGDAFDCMYLFERALIHGLVSSDKKRGYLLETLSRLATTPCIMKKEFFSSSAYGDSEFNRLYIPGRLSYDLLIHYKRGMKKYPSYKLDYIAGEILNEGKHDVSAKEIFKYYEKGDPDKIKHIGQYCFVEGTRISLKDCSVDIKELDTMDCDVVTWFEDKNGFGSSKKVHYFDNGMKDCLQVTLLDGTKIQCTHDHLFLTTSGWIEAQHLTDKDKILMYPEPAYCNYGIEKNDTYIFSETIGELDYKKACIFSRILGYLLTDGTISSDKCYKNYSTRQCYLYDTAIIHLGTKSDALRMQEDILCLTGKKVAIGKSKNTFYTRLPSQLTKMYLSVAGVDKGRRLSSSINLPDFIKKDDCPLWVVREFLKGLMGGDGSCPSFSQQDNKFSSVVFVQSKDYEHVHVLSEMMKTLQSLFQKLNVNTKIGTICKNKLGDGYTQSLTIPMNNLIAFYENVGYSYCDGKTYKLAVVASYYKLRNETQRQSEWVKKRVIEFQKTMTQRDAIKLAHQELKNKEPIFNSHYSLPTSGINRACENPGKYRTSKFPSAHDYLITTGSYERFVTGTSKKSYAIQSNDEYTPCYYMSILAKKDIGMHKVYDIEVKDTHNFVANGAVVHNCIQDTELLQKLVDKQLILTNIMQLANVTFVPIGFLLTRGQTIKVYSQILRKARQMDFLVPHTNFNEDNFSILFKTKEPCSFTDEHVGDYVNIALSSMGQNKGISAKIMEIVDEHTVLALADTEITQEYYNRKVSYKGRDYLATRVWTNDDAIDDSFTGATVLEPVPGMYTDNIAVLDFASLYPTIQISRNVCFSTYVMNDKYAKEEGVNYETIAWNDKIEYKLKQTCQAVGKSGASKGKICGKQAYFCVDDNYYCRIHDTQKKERPADEKCQKKDVSYSYTIVQPQIGEDGSLVNKGVIPSLLEDLYSERKKVKKMMATAQQTGNKLLADILDSTQLAIKISLNSVYGFLGRNQGNLVCKPLGQVTTALGRMLIDESKQYAEGQFCDYIKTENEVKHYLTTKSELLENLTDADKQKILQVFRV
jgi:DNA polymerase elongation subunit (family B)